MVPGNADPHLRPNCIIAQLRPPSDGCKVRPDGFSSLSCLDLSWPSSSEVRWSTRSQHNRESNMHIFGVNTSVS